MLAESRHVAVAISRPADDVYSFASDPRNVPRWAPGLASSIAPGGDMWVADSPMGKVRVRFVESNPYRVLDHMVRLPSGEEVHNPMRVLPCGDGCEVVFSLYRRSGISDKAFEEDAAAVLRDLQSLKRLMESETAADEPQASLSPRNR